MKHDFDNPEYCKALKYLFSPGSGAPPPVLAGRDNELTLMNDYLEMVQGETDNNEQLLSPVPHDVVLYGPRGNGKTVLLGELKKACHTQNIDVVSFRPKVLMGIGHMAELLLHNGKSKTGDLFEKTKPDTLSVSIPGLVKADWESLSIGEKDEIQVRHLKELLGARCRINPLVIIIDEAHTLALKMGTKLFNIFEELRNEGARCLAVLAGTPNLPGRFNKMNATFWERSEKLTIGRLDEESTIAALKEPLEALSVQFDAEALERVVKDTQHYPYFIQLWGQALCDVLVKNKEGHTVTSNVVDEAASIVQSKRGTFYLNRYDELKKQKLLPAAEIIGNAFETEVVAHEETLLKALRHELDIEGTVCEEQLEKMFDLGYIWRPDSGDFYEPGIPSLMTYVQEQARIKEAVLKDGVFRD